MVTSTPVWIGIDVGGTRVKGAIVDSDYRLLRTASIPSMREGGPDAVIGQVIALAGDLESRISQARPSGIGVVVPGEIDAERGVAVRSANLAWRDVPLRDLASQQLGLPATLGHDARAGALAELRRGRARGVREVLYLPIGTGISAAMVVGGTVLSGFVGEIGHIDAGTGLQCACGATGCLETVASAASIGSRYAHQGRRTSRAGAASAVSGAAVVAAAVTRGDPEACAIWDEAVAALARALACYQTLLDPELVVVGGGLAGAGEVLTTPLRRSLDARLSFQRRPRIVTSALGPWSNSVGAAILAAERLPRALARH